MKAPSFTVTAGAVLIGIAGFIAGRNSSKTDDSPILTQPSNLRTKSSMQVGLGSDGTSTQHQTGSSRKSSRVQSSESQEDYTSMTPEKKAESLRAMILGEDPLARNIALLEWISKLPPSELANAVDDFRKLRITESRMSEYGILLAAWAKADPISALSYAQESTGGMFATHTILSTWATTDPDAAILWAQKNHSGDGANPYMAGIIRGVVATNPQQATELLSSMPRSQERGDALDAMLPHILSQGNDAAISWISSLGEDVLRNGALMRSIEPLASSNPSATLALLMATPGEARDRRMDDLYTTWSQKQPEEALKSAASIQDDTMRANAIRGVITASAMNNPQEALSLMNQHASDLTDRTVQSFVWHAFSDHPAVAVQEIARIGDQGQRDRMYRRLVGEWIDRDQASAVAWVRNHPLPQPVMDEINRKIQERQ